MIQVTNVTKRFGKNVAVADLSLSVNKGEFFGFLGPNGAGKTTTIKMLTGLLRPDEGTVQINGVDIQENPEKAKSFLVLVPDKPFVYEKLTGGEYLRFIADLYSVELAFFKRKKDELLELFSLSDKEDELIEGYSHGMRQKLIITSCLIHSPDLIVIDESMVGLDPKGALQVKELFAELVRNGTTIFMSTHAMSTAQEMCSRIAIIQKGRILVQGTMDELRVKSAEEAQDLEQVFLRLTEEGEGAEHQG